MAFKLMPQAILRFKKHKYSFLWWTMNLIIRDWGCDLRLNVWFASMETLIMSCSILGNWRMYSNVASPIYTGNPLIWFYTMSAYVPSSCKTIETAITFDCCMTYFLLRTQDLMFCIIHGRDMTNEKIYHCFVGSIRHRNSHNFILVSPPRRFVAAESGGEEDEEERLFGVWSCFIIS